MFVLVLESSTSAAKALLYDTDTQSVVSVKQKYPPEICNFGKIDAKGIFDATVAAARELASGKDIAAIAISCTWHSLAVCDKKINAVTPMFFWNCLDSAPLCKEMRRDDKLTDWLYQRTGCMPHATYPRHSIQYAMANGVSVENSLVISQGAYTFYHLTGVLAESVSVHAGSGFLDAHTLDFDDEVLKFVGLNRSQLADIVTYRDIQPLNQHGARLLGLKSGIPVVPAYPDGALDQVGNCSNIPGAMTLSVGTSGAIRMISEKPILPKAHQLWCYYGVDHWISGAATAGACSCLDWFKRDIISEKWTYEELEQFEEGEPPVFLPFIYGERCPGWNDDRTGGFCELTAKHTLPKMFESLYMGILFNIYQCYNISCRENCVPNKITVSGGIVNSLVWTQMLADIMQREILVNYEADASALGAAALALWAAGALKDVSLFREGKANVLLLSPRPEKAEYYSRQYNRYLENYKNQLYYNNKSI